MDGYLQTALVANTGSPQPNRTSHLAKLLKPCPPSNKEFSCDNFHAVEGTYQLVQDIHFNTLAPQFSSGTYASILDVRPKHLAKSSSSAASSSTGDSPAATSSTPPPPSTSTEHEDDIGSSTATLPPPPPLSLGSARTGSTPCISLQSTPQLSPPPPGVSASTHLPLTHPVAPRPPSLDEMGVSRSAALPIPNVVAKSYDSSSSSLQHTNGTLTPPHSRATPPIHHHYHNASSVTPTPNSSTPFTADTAPLENTSSSNGISDLSTSVSSLSALFSRRNSVRFMHSPQRKPKNNLAKTKSSFVLRMIIHERLAHHLANRTIDDSFLFFNVGTSFLWMDANGKPKDPLSRIVFTKAYPTCHDVNLMTKCNEHLDVIIGFSSGDCVWYDPLTSKYFRLNKDGNMKRGVITNIKWIPGSDDLFMVSFTDGTILILDKDREDQAYTTTLPANSAGDHQFYATHPHKSAKYNPVAHWSVNPKGVLSFEFSPDGIYLAIIGMDGTLRVIDHQQERLLDIFTSYYGNFRCVAWSPDGRYILTGGEDDLVTIWGFAEKRIVARCQGHKSWVTNVAFDPYRCDDKVYRFGSVGEDCKLILWDFSFSALHRPKNKRRTTGNTPKSPRSPKETHRFSFVGADTMKNRTPALSQMFDRLSTYDLNEATANKQQQQQPLQQPQQKQQYTFGFKKQSAMTATASNYHHHHHNHHRLHSSPPTKLDYLSAAMPHHLSMPTLHPAPSKKQVPLLQPSTCRTIHADPCVDLIFRHDGIVTTDRRGRIRTWGRP